MRKRHADMFRREKKPAFCTENKPLLTGYILCVRLGSRTYKSRCKAAVKSIADGTKDYALIILPHCGGGCKYQNRFAAMRKSQAFIAHKFSPFILSNFNMTIWPPSIPLVGSLRFPLLCSSCPLQFPPFSHVSHTAYADSPISRKQARKATSLLIYPSIFRG